MFFLVQKVTAVNVVCFRALLVRYCLPVIAWLQGDAHPQTRRAPKAPPGGPGPRYIGDTGSPRRFGLAPDGLR